MTYSVIEPSAKFPLRSIGVCCQDQCRVFRGAEEVGTSLHLHSRQFPEIPQSPFGRQLYRARTVGLIREAQPTLEVDGMRIYDIDLEYFLSTRLCGGRERTKVVQSLFRIRHRDGYPH
jgi:hypothetical protein